MVSSSGEKAGKMLLCTVHGDLHDIGKNIVKAFFEASGFDILDLGIDTPVDKIVATAKEQGIKLIGLSGVLTLAIDSMKDTVDGFKAAGMRDDVKIIIGGNCVTADVCKSVGADSWSTSPQAAAATCLEWLKAA
jgi:methanogenic corrinoid protein MtbC1